MTEIIAVPSQLPGGMDAPMSAHFGHCDVFTLVTICDGEVTEVSVSPTPDHVHGGCMVPVQMLADLGATSIVSVGMGQRPLTGFQQVGIRPFLAAECDTVKDAVQAMIGGKLVPFESVFVCGGDHEHAE